MSTSLVFLLVLGLWAAYLVQQWKYRHERLVTAQVADAFQDAVRVLDRQQVPQSTGATGQRTTPAAPLLSSRPALTRPVPGSAHRRVADITTDALRMRKLGLAASVAVALAALVASIAGLVGWYVGLAGIALVGLDVAYLRATAAAFARPAVRRRSSTPAARDAAAAAPAVDPAVAVDPAEPAGRSFDAAELVDHEATIGIPIVRHEPRDEASATVVIPVEASPRRRREPELFDIAAFDEPAPVAESVEPEPLEPGTWRPTPVPAPLYTRKEQAPAAHVVEPTVPAVPVAEVMEPVDIDDDILDTPSPYARVVNG